MYTESKKSALPTVSSTSYLFFVFTLENIYHLYNLIRFIKYVYVNNTHLLLKIIFKL